MRRPKYRALSTNNKNWVYGYPLLYEIYGENWIADKIGRKRNIKPETLGQFTGLEDKNGKRIYEGDIVTAWSQGIEANCTVKWGENIVGFFLYRKPDLSWSLVGNNGVESVEVIGNVHQNPK